MHFSKNRISSSVTKYCCLVTYLHWSFSGKSMSWLRCAYPEDIVGYIDTNTEVVLCGLWRGYWDHRDISKVEASNKYSVSVINMETVMQSRSTVSQSFHFFFSIYDFFFLRPILLRPLIFFLFFFFLFKHLVLELYQQQCFIYMLKCYFVRVSVDPNT